MADGMQCGSWRTKPTDRFILKWIKCRICAGITPRLTPVPWVRPWMITVLSAGLGVLAGVLFSVGLGFSAGIVGAAGQIMDGVDGQLARLTDRQTRAGAFLDSVLDRYADGALVIGMVIYLVRLHLSVPLWIMLFLGALAWIGSSLVSYTSARAEALGIDLGPPTLASKGTRTSVIVLCGLGSPLCPSLPMAALLYLVLHPNAVVVARLIRATKQAAPGDGPLEPGRPKRP